MLTIAKPLNFVFGQKTFANHLSHEIAAGGLTVIDAIERLIEEWLEDTVSKDLNDYILKAPRAIVHSTYYIHRFQNLAVLSSNGYDTWYPEVRFSTDKNVDLKIPRVNASGIVFESLRYGDGIEQQFVHRQRELKTQVNHTIRFNRVTVPSSVFVQTICNLKIKNHIAQPYIANLTVGCENYIDDRIEGFRIVAFDHVVTGERRFCSCHLQTHASMLKDAEARATRYTPDSWPHRVIRLLEGAVYIDDICHFCVSERHGQDAHFDWFGDQIQKHFGPYVDLLVRGTNMDLRTAKVEARRKLSLNRWVREEELYILISRLFPNTTVRREASPNWLGQLRLDIYLPELKLAVEHQGEQHFRSIDAFGGELAFAKTKERDVRKRTLCRENGVTVVDIRFDEPLTISSLRFRLARWTRN